MENYTGIQRKNRFAESSKYPTWNRHRIEMEQITRNLQEMKVEDFRI
jgi:hypothetical protein